MQVKHSFSRQHFSAAKHFAEAGESLEKSIRQPQHADRTKHRAYVTGAVLSAVAALEASINELYLEANDQNKMALAGLSDPIIANLATEWSNVEPYELLDKYQAALKTAGNPEFDRGSLPFQDVDSLVYLRNALVHYKPEWDNEAKVHAKLRSRLHSRFPLNPFAASSSLWFPHQCLGAGCARWAVESIEQFMADFCLRMGIPRRF